jgi:hypothetical protein
MEENQRIDTMSYSILGSAIIVDDILDSMIEHRLEKIY